MRHADLPRVLRRAVGLMRFARRSVGADAASLFLLDAERGELRGLVSEWDWTRTSFSSSLADWPNVGAALENGATASISLENARGSEVGWFETRGITTTACVPVRVNGRTLGVFFFDFGPNAPPLEKAGTALLLDVGCRCGRALARAPGALPEAGPMWLH